MKKNGPGREGYVYRVRDTTRRYLGELLKENQKLSSLIEALEEERKQHQNLVVAARAEIEREREQREQLERRIDEIRAECQSFADQHEEIERQNNDLAHLYVASYRLHESAYRRAQERAES